MVVSGAMEQIADRDRSLVFLDAHMPRTGESVFDMIGADRAEIMAGKDGKGWYIPPSDASWWGISAPAAVAWVNSKTTAQPLKTYCDPTGPTERAWAHPGREPVVLIWGPHEFHSDVP
jgi:hypothetical protein